jgi:hypothetical protein
MAAPNGDGSVSFTVKELILQLDAKVDTLVQLVADKANTAEVTALAYRVTSLETAMEHRAKHAHTMANSQLIHESRLVKLETNQIATAAVQTYKKWLLAGGGLVSVSTILSIVVLVRTLL